MCGVFGNGYSGSYGDVTEDLDIRGDTPFMAKDCTN
jgi:hypothetical protein